MARHARRALWFLIVALALPAWLLGALLLGSLQVLELLRADYSTRFEEDD